jgi:hypothetical protein
VAAATDSVTVPYFTGTAMLTGIVRGAEGRPIAGAQVRLADAASVTRTDSLGRFTLTNLPAGTQLLQVKQLGYFAADENIELRRGATSTRDIRLSRVVSLDSVHVVGERLDMQDFEARSRGAFGHYLRASDIAKRGVGDVISVVRQVPGFRVEGRGAEARIFSAQASEIRGLRACNVNVVIDRMQFLEVGLVRPDEVRAMEFYTGPNGAPSQFTSECGLIVIWTKNARRAPTKVSPSVQP